ncbi:MAG: DUF4430 domain-containing protein [Lachnospiraceae bacterium]|nr:DUF4430 domain-containing protein [Lachnospiraceae bacterium]
MIRRIAGIIALLLCSLALFGCKVETPEEHAQTEGGELTCTIKIDCITVLDNMGSLKESKKSLIPEDGIICDTTEVKFNQGDTAFDVLVKLTRDKGIHMEYNKTPAYNSVYIEGIANLYELDCGELSGWTYLVNGEGKNYGCDQYVLEDGDVIEWRYTCDLGRDTGAFKEE